MTSSSGTADKLATSVLCVASQECARCARAWAGPTSLECKLMCVRTRGCQHCAVVGAALRPQPFTLFANFRIYPLASLGRRHSDVAQ